MSLLPAAQLQNFILYANQSAVVRTLQSCGLPYQLGDSYVTFGATKIACSWLSGNAFDAVVTAQKAMQPKDILFTLSASKASFPTGSPGHTAYLRQSSKRDLAMFFHGPKAQVLLLSDHIALEQVRKKLSTTGITDLVTLALESYQKFFAHLPQQVLFAGVNPHAGENGILGDDSALMKPAITALNQRFKSIKFGGPVSGDTLFQQADKDTWLVYSFHDQGLAPFKATHGLIGANITLGLDYLRLSVDHGTAPDLFSRNKANYLGCLYCLQLALKTLAKI